MPVSSSNANGGDQSVPPTPDQSAGPAAPASGAPAASTAPSKPYGKPYNKWKNSPPPPPTNCVVLKNLDYNITQISLEEVVRRVTGGRKEFVNINLIEDKATGMFRGMAFVNFHTTADATAALAELSKMVINGRKVVAEYRRLKPGEKERLEKRQKKLDLYNNSNRQTFEKDIQDTDEKGVRVDKRAAFFAKRDTVKKNDEQKRNEEKAERDREREAEFRKTLLEYKAAEIPEGSEVTDLVFESSLTSYERRMVHMICAEIELGHLSRLDDNGNRVLHVTKDPDRKAEWDKESASIKASQKKDEAQRKKNKENNGVSEWKKGDVSAGGPLTKEELQGIKWFKPRAAMEGSGDSGEASDLTAIRAPTYKLYVPPRQPSGPDGTVGFSSRNPDNDDDTQDDSVKEDETDGAEENGTSETNDGNEMGSEDTECVQDEQLEKQKDASNEKGSTHTVLNPSVPAFSPSFTQSY